MILKNKELGIRAQLTTSLAPYGVTDPEIIDAYMVDATSAYDAAFLVNYDAAEVSETSLNRNVSAIRAGLAGVAAYVDGLGL